MSATRVGKIEFGPHTQQAHLTRAPTDGKVGLYVPITDLTKAAQMLERFADILKNFIEEPFGRDEILRVAKSLKGQR